MKSLTVRHIELKPFQWIHPRGSFVSRCDLDVYLGADHALIVATEREQDPNSGLSISIGAVTLATIIMQKFGLHPQHMTWIEHYPLKALGRGTPYQLGEYYNQVRFRFDGRQLTDPRWEPIDKDGVEVLIEAFAQQAP